MSTEKGFTNYGRKGEGHIDLKKAAKERRQENLLEGSGEYETGKAAQEFMQKLDGKEAKESFKDLHQAISGDIEAIRRMVAEYNNIENRDLRELKGQEILSYSEKITSEIESQIKESVDPFEKGEFDNLRIELENIVKNIEQTPERKVVNG